MYDTDIDNESGFRANGYHADKIADNTLMNIYTLKDASSKVRAALGNSEA